MYEVYRDGEATKRLFLSEENARLYINTRTDGAAYDVRPYRPKEERRSRGA